MFAGMDVIPKSSAFAYRPRSASSSDPGPREQHPQKRDHCISILTGVSSCKKKLSKRPGYMRKDVEQTLHHPPLVGVHFVSQHVENERKTCTDLSFNNNKLEGYCLNNRKHLREDKFAEQQITVSNHLTAGSPVVAAFQPAMTMSESIRCSDSNCQGTDGCDGSCHTGINTCSKHLPIGCLQKQDACLTQCEKDKDNDVSKPQAVTSPNKRVDCENLQKLQPWDKDEEINSANAFISSFSFIQMSLNCHSINSDSKELQQNGFVSTLQLPQTELHLKQYHVNTLATNQFCPKPLRDNVEIPCLHVCQSVDIKCGTNTESKDRPQVYDSLSLDAEFPFLCSTDSSDYSSGSSVTSGYESSITAFDQKCNSLLRRYELILQDCLLENRMTLKLQSLILKLKNLQKKAIQDDDYEKADKFNKKLAELKREKSSLKFQLPSYHPCIARFLQEVKLQAQVVEHHNNAGSLLQSVEDKYSDSNPDNLQISWSRRKQLILDKQQLQEEITDLKERLAVLEAKDHQLSIEIEEESRLIHSYDCELPSLSTLSAIELQDLSKILEDVMPLRNKIFFNAELPEDIKRLQKKEQSLNMAIKTATTKVFSSQKLCSNLRKKVSNIETQLPTLLEAKMLAISGHEFSTAKDLAEEIKSLTSEKTRFEELISDLQDLSIKNSQQVEAIREHYSSLRTEVEQEEDLFENNLKENVFKYMEVLEDKLRSYGSQLLEKVWEADLEACQLFVRGLQLKEGSYRASKKEEFQADEENEAIEVTCAEVKDTKDHAFPSKQDWCAIRCSVMDQKETDPSEVSIKCSFNIKDTQSEVAYKGSAVDIGEQCEIISDRLLCLEGQLQMAINNHDDSLSQYLQREIQMVKETLQAMLKQLLPLGKEEKEELGDFVFNSW
ncbi:disrupted in schizophrenia 1 protein isoform X1 [Carcharodon carcharias]|uniref:disrupted in schizophrenia 1 protein isoform X1 n=1 Tax=Carcharodon carcharias TaxID=13397 RepID=UPI001B7E8370|nr:disrupted in schizophrenia 1 protein isoform X1 [Carcharodon carcharias]